MLAVAWDEPHPFTELHEFVSTLEIYGLAGFGWGVSWLADGKTREVRGLGRYVDEGYVDGGLRRDELGAASSHRFLVHLRRPNKLSTVQLADTQPFLHDGDYAFCHNGFLDRAEKFRPTYASRLAGAADSEVGWVFLQDRLAAGAAPTEALHEVDETFGGKVNLGYLGADGELAVYSRNVSNAMWTFDMLGARMATTGIHSDDDSIFRLVFPAATNPALVPSGTSVIIGRAET